MINFGELKVTMDTEVSTPFVNINHKTALLPSCGHHTNCNDENEDTKEHAEPLQEDAEPQDTPTPIFWQTIKRKILTNMVITANRVFAFSSFLQSTFKFSIFTNI